jgi:hypothetical protein
MPGHAKQVMPPTHLKLYRQFSYLQSLSLTVAKFKPLVLCVLGPQLVLCCEHLHFHDFVRLLLPACRILRYNRKHVAISAQVFLLGFPVSKSKC